MCLFFCCARSRILCSYTIRPPATQWCGPAGRFCAPCTGCSFLYPCFRAHIALCYLLFGSSLPLCAPHWPSAPPTPPLCFLCCAGSFGLFCLVWFFFFSLFFFTLLPASTQDTAALVVSCGDSPLVSSLVLSPPWGFPLGGPGPCQVGAPPLPPPLCVLIRRAPLALPPLTFHCFPRVRRAAPIPATALSSWPTRAAPPAPVLLRVGQLGRPLQVTLEGNPPSFILAALPAIRSLMVGRAG